RVRAEEVAGAYDDDAGATASRGLEAPLHLDTDRALASLGMLRAVLAQRWKRVWSEVVDRAGQHDPSADRARRGDRVVEHRQQELVPAAIAGRVHRVNDHARALRCAEDVLRVHRIARDPLERR